MTEPTIEPMNIYEALEVMKIIGPHASEITKAALNHTGAAAIAVLLKRARENNPINFLRLLALMKHEDIEKCAEDVQKFARDEIFLELAELFSVNPLADLVGASRILGLTKSG